MFGLQERVSGPPLRRGRRIGGRQTIGALVILMYYTFASLANNMTLSPSPIGGALPVQPRPQTWFERNWKWLVPVLIVVALIVCGAFVGGVIYFVESTLRSSYPYQLAVKRATESPAVTARLGRLCTSDGLSRATWASMDQRETPVSAYQSPGRAEKEASKWLARSTRITGIFKCLRWM
jgi:hypothetical protein